MLFSTITIGEKILQCKSEFSFKYKKDKLGFITKEHSEGVSGWKIMKRTHQGRGILAKPT